MNDPAQIKHGLQAVDQIKHKPGKDMYTTTI